MQLGNNIQTLRKRKGLSQEKLAEKINVTRQTISNWELGETAPNPEQLILLSKELDISIDELVGNDAMPSGSSRENKSIKDIYIGLIALCGIVACVWAFSANRFRYVEILGITIAGAERNRKLVKLIADVTNLSSPNGGYWFPLKQP